MIDATTLDRIRMANPLADVLRRDYGVELKRDGAGRWKGLCSFHTEKSPSFTVFEKDNTYHCFGCGERGDVFTFAMKRDGLSFPQAVEKFAWRGGVAMEGAGVVGSEVQEVAPRSKPVLPSMRPGTAVELETLAKLRNLSVEGLHLAVERGLLGFGSVRGHAAWLVTDASRWNCQARRLDGGLWDHLEKPVKAYTLPGCRASWPIGITEMKGFPVIALVEGGPDLLGAFHFAWAEGREREVAPVCLTGAANRIPDDALPCFAGKRIRIFPHLDEAGSKAARQWTDQLQAVAQEVDCFDLSGIPTAASGRVKDLNDLCNLDADTFETDRELWSVFP